MLRGEGEEVTMGLLRRFAEKVVESLCLVLYLAMLVSLALLPFIIWLIIALFNEAARSMVIGIVAALINIFVWIPFLIALIEEDYIPLPK